MNRLGYYLREGVDSIFNHSLISVATVCIILACLLVMGSFAAVALNVNYIIDGLEDQVVLLAFVDDSIPEDEARAIEPDLLGVDNVAAVEFVTKQQALDDFLSEQEYREIFDGLEADTLRDRYLVYLNDVSILAGTQEALRHVAGIATVKAHLGIAQGMVAVRHVVNIVSIVMIALLFLVSIVVMTNTLRLAAFTRRNEVAIVKMMGATNSFIRGPFNVEGMILGLTGSLVAFLAQWAIYSVVAEKLSASALSFIRLLPFGTMELPMLVCFVAVGVLVAIFGSRVAIRNYMRV